MGQHIWLKIASMRSIWTRGRIVAADEADAATLPATLKAAAENLAESNLAPTLEKFCVAKLSKIASCTAHSRPGGPVEFDI